DLQNNMFFKSGSYITETKRSNVSNANVPAIVAFEENEIVLIPGAMLDANVHQPAYILFCYYGPAHGSISSKWDVVVEFFAHRAAAAGAGTASAHPATGDGA